jgi:hypothetical protein
MAGSRGRILGELKSCRRNGKAVGHPDDAVGMKKQWAV